MPAEQAVGLVALAILPLIFFHLSSQVNGIFKPFRIVFATMGFISIIFFMGYLVTFISVSLPEWLLVLGVAALMLIYLWAELLNLFAGSILWLKQQYNGK